VAKGQTQVVQLDFHITPLRSEKFVNAYRPAVPLAADYGAKGYTFYRTDEDPYHFVHISYWSDRADFDRYWMSREMRGILTSINGYHDHLLLPYYGAVLERA
jgi:quinol monooxygenase YgiN